MGKYEELKKQIELEFGWAKNLYEKNKIKNPDKLDFDRGTLFAYESIMSKIKSLEED